MAVDYSISAINYRLLGVVDAIDSGGGNGYLVLLAGSTPVSTISLARPSGTVNGGVLTFSGTLLDTSAAATGLVNGASIYASNGTLMVSGLTVGIPPSSDYDILITNGLNSTLITAGQVVSVLSAQIAGS